MGKRTTINIEKTVRDKLKEVKKYPYEPYNETLKRLIKQMRKVK